VLRAGGSRIRAGYSGGRAAVHRGRGGGRADRRRRPAAEADGELGLVLGALLQQPRGGRAPAATHAEALLERVGATPQQRVRLRAARHGESLGRGETSTRRVTCSTLGLDGGRGCVRSTTAPDWSRCSTSRGTVHDRAASRRRRWPTTRRALAICEELLSGDHPDVAAILSQHGVRSRPNGGQVRVAREHYERALAIQPRVRRGPPGYRPDLPEPRDLLQQIGTTTARRRVTSRRWRSRASRAAPTPRSPTSFYNLGGIYQLRGEYERALRAVPRRAGSQRAPPRARPPGRGLPAGRPGGRARRARRHAEARELLERALAIRTRKDRVPVDLGELRFALGSGGRARRPRSRAGAGDRRRAVTTATPADAEAVERSMLG
jgi:tetratricopeptide (TPR) repeat protein